MLVVFASARSLQLEIEKKNAKRQWNRKLLKSSISWTFQLGQRRTGALRRLSKIRTRRCLCTLCPSSRRSACSSPPDGPTRHGTGCAGASFSFTCGNDIPMAKRQEADTSSRSAKKRVRVWTAVKPFARTLFECRQSCVQGLPLSRGQTCLRHFLQNMTGTKSSLLTELTHFKNAASQKSLNQRQI